MACDSCMSCAHARHTSQGAKRPMPCCPEPHGAAPCTLLCPAGCAGGLIARDAVVLVGHGGMHQSYRDAPALLPLCCCLAGAFGAPSCAACVSAAGSGPPLLLCVHGADALKQVPASSKMRSRTVCGGRSWMLVDGGAAVGAATAVMGLLVPGLSLVIPSSVPGAWLDGVM